MSAAEKPAIDLPLAEPHDNIPQPHAQTATGFHRFLEVASTVLFPLALLVTCWPVGVTLYNQDLLWLGAVMMPLAWLASDAFTGTIHWMFDTYWSEDTPILGKNFVQPFREHHVAPKNITLHDIPSTVGNSCILGMMLQPVLLLWAFLAPDSVISALTIIFISLTFFGAALTNLFHKWSHADDNPGIVRALQASGLILGPKHHKIHHTPPFDTYYCITCGWMNPVLAKLRYFRAMERVLGWVGIQPNIER